MSKFIIHPQLITDCKILGRIHDSHVLLHKNSAVTWFILVPETTTLEFLDLPESLQTTLIQQCSRIARFIRQETLSTKINFAAIGNQVPQLHLHIVGRHSADPSWPQPVWGHLAEWRDYTAAELDRMTAQLIQHIGLTPTS